MRKEIKNLNPIVSMCIFVGRVFSWAMRKPFRGWLENSNGYFEHHIVMCGLSVDLFPAFKEFEYIKNLSKC